MDTKKETSNSSALNHLKTRSLNQSFGRSKLLYISNLNKKTEISLNYLFSFTEFNNIYKSLEDKPLKVKIVINSDINEIINYAVINKIKPNFLSEKNWNSLIDKDLSSKELQIIIDREEAKRKDLVELLNN